MSFLQPHAHSLYPAKTYVKPTILPMSSTLESGIHESFIHEGTGIFAIQTQPENPEVESDNYLTVSRPRSIGPRDHFDNFVSIRGGRSL